MDIVKMLAKAIGKNAEDITPSLEKDGVLLEGDALQDAVSSLIVAHISLVKKEQHKRATREVLGKVRSRVKAAWENAPTDVEDDIELLDQFIGTKFDSGNTVTKEDLQKNPIVKQIVTESVAEQKKRYADMEATLKGQMSEIQQGAAKAMADTAIRSEIEKAKIILGDTDEVKTKRIETIKRLVFDGKKIQSSDKGIVFVDNDGNVETDDAGNPITLASVVKKQGEIFGFHTQNPKKSGSGAGAGTGAGASAKIVFSSESEFTNYVSKQIDLKLRAEAYEAWAAQNKDE
jgi:hypothetical protein